MYLLGQNLNLKINRILIAFKLQFKKLVLFSITNLILTTFYILYIPETLLNSRYELFIMLCYLSLGLFFVSRKLQKRKIYCFFFKNRVPLFMLNLFFFHKMTPRKNYMLMYLKCPTLILK